MSAPMEKKWNILPGDGITNISKSFYLIKNLKFQHVYLIK